MRKLLNAKAVADKLGRTHNWFCREKQNLYRQNFPRPVLGDRKHGHARWDPAAIDAWLDLRMPADLRSQHQHAAKPVATVDYNAILQNRLASMTGGT